MQGGKSEPVGRHDADDRSVGNVDADFHDGGGDKDIELLRREPVHDVQNVLLLHVPRNNTDAGAVVKVREVFLGQLLHCRYGHYILKLAGLRIFDEGTNQVALMALLDFRIHFLENFVRGQALGGFDRLTACGHRPNGQDSQLIAVYRHCDASRDGRGSHRKMVHTGLVVLFQFTLLLDAKFVLLVDDGHAQVVGNDFVTKHRVGANEHLDFTCFKRL